MLELKNVSKAFNPGTVNEKKALDGLSVSLADGDFVTIVGSNGAGKSTLFNAVAGDFYVDEGSVTLDGEPVTPENIARLSFATCEHSFFPGLSPAAHRDFYRAHFPAFREKRFDALMDFFELPLRRAARGLSTGQKNQLEVSLALSQGADYILMDEPFSGSDVFNREDFYRLLLGLLEPQETILLSTHLLEEVQHFISRAVLLDRGAVAGDVTTGALEERGESLMDFVKSALHYRSDRVLKALEQLDDGEGE